MDIETPMLLEDSSANQNSTSQNRLTYEAMLDIMTTQDTNIMKFKLQQLPTNQLQALSEYFGVEAESELPQAITKDVSLTAHNQLDRLKYAILRFIVWELLEAEAKATLLFGENKKDSVDLLIKAFFNGNKPCLFSLLSPYFTGARDFKYIKSDFMTNHYRAIMEKEFEKYIEKLAQDYSKWPSRRRRNARWRKRKPTSPVFTETTISLMQDIKAVLNL
jgi:hypothetical protein